MKNKKQIEQRVAWLDQRNREYLEKSRIESENGNMVQSSHYVVLANVYRQQRNILLWALESNRI